MVWLNFTFTYPFFLSYLLKDYNYCRPLLTSDQAIFLGEEILGILAGLNKKNFLSFTAKAPLQNS
jgi:hypothetical protein